MKVNINPSWQAVLQPDFELPYFQTLTERVREAYGSREVFPPAGLIFNAFNLTPFEEVKVVILGQVYRNFKVINGQKVAHTIDVRTGRPAHQNILSATVVAPTCMEADAWATAFMALGLERSKLILEQHPELQVCLVYSTGESGKYQTFERGLELTRLEK